MFANFKTQFVPHLWIHFISLSNNSTYIFVCICCTLQKRDLFIKSSLKSVTPAHIRTYTSTTTFNLHHSLSVVTQHSFYALQNSQCTFLSNITIGVYLYTYIMFFLLEMHWKMQCCEQKNYFKNCIAKLFYFLQMYFFLVIDRMLKSL